MPTATDARPKKPYPEFPLFPHRNGQWAKKVKQRTWFFGVWSDPDAALRKYLSEVNEIQAGRDPRRMGVAEVSSTELTIADLCNLFLNRQRSRVKSGEVGSLHFTDNLKTCRTMVGHFGRFVRAAALRAADFKSFRESFPSTWGAAKIGNEIQRVRTVFRWGAEAELIPALPNFGPDFKKPSRTTSRREQQQKQAERGGKLDFTAGEIRSLLTESSGWLRACILLGLNGGLGNSDCGRLSTKFLDLDSGWYDLPRHKTGIPRRFRLWPETIAAIRLAMQERKNPKSDEDSSLCFLTSHGRPVWWECVKPNGESHRRDNINLAFAKLVTKAGSGRTGRGYYSLRRTFETVAGNTKDQVAVDYVMGHADESMGAVYRQGIDDQRLIDVSNYVRRWLLGATVTTATTEPDKAS